MCEACEKVIYCVFSSSKSHWDTRCATQNVFDSNLAMHQHFFVSFDSVKKNFSDKNQKLFLIIRIFFLISWLETVEYIPSPFPGEMRMYSLETRYYSTYLPRATPHKNCVLTQIFWQNFIFVIWLEMKKMPHVLFYIKYLNNAISFTSTHHSSHQRPPSVGMPRHALRRRAPRYTPDCGSG